jgi:hypothetical protein
MPYKQCNTSGRTLIFIVLTVTIAVCSSISYFTLIRWHDRHSLIERARADGCQYLGRILGTESVVVMRCGENIIMREEK